MRSMNGRSADDRPFVRGRIARAAAAAQAGLTHQVNELIRRERGDGTAQRDESVVAQVLVEVGRVEFAAVLGRDADLSIEERRGAFGRHVELQ